MSNGPRHLFTSESVTEGHPDKICDQISDAVLDAVLAQDPLGRVACEAVTTTGLVFVTGEITTGAVVDYTKLVRDTIRGIGYTHQQAGGFDADTCAVLIGINKQSPDIAGAVDQAWEMRQGGVSQQEIDRQLDQIGAGDQGMMFGYACTETPELMPLPISLAHKLAQRLAMVRHTDVLPYLRPDGKTQLTVEYEGFRPVRVHTVVISAQHAPEVEGETDAQRIQAILARDLRRHVIEPVVSTDLLDAHTHYYINPSGRFVIGGPQGDAGLTGRKVVVDTYGGYCRHGGGALSGKDPTKVDRSGAYAARYVAKNIVAAGLAERCEVQIGYAIGVARPVSIAVETFGTGRIPDERILALIQEHFELRPAGIINVFHLRRPIYRQTATYGHFGRPDLSLPWEQLDRVEVLRRATGSTSSMPVSV